MTDGIVLFKRDNNLNGRVLSFYCNISYINVIAAHASRFTESTNVTNVILLRIIPGSVRFTEIICVEKSAEPIQNVDDNLLTHDLSKKQELTCF